MTKAMQIFGSALASAGLQPYEPRHKWIYKNHVISRGPLQGLIKMETEPLLYGIFEAMDTHREVYLCGASGTGKTTIMLAENDWAQRGPDPGPVFNACSSEYQQGKFSTIFDNWAKRPDNRRFFPRLSVDEKCGLFGDHVIANVQSGDNLRGNHSKTAIIDELDAGKSPRGDIMEQMRSRLTIYETVGSSLLIAMSTPLDKGTSAIWSLADDAGLFRWFVPCLGCGAFHTLDFIPNKLHDNPECGVVIPNGDIAAAYHVCPHCGRHQTDLDKPEMIRNGEWRQTKEKNTPESRIGFQWGRLDSAGHTFVEIARRWAGIGKGHGRLDRFRTFMNDVLGLPFDRSVALEVDPKARSLFAKREPFDLSRIPAGVQFVTIGVDTQDSWLEVQFVGWGYDWEWWVLAHIVIEGQTETIGPWDRLGALIDTHLVLGSGRTVRAACAMIDAGGHRGRQVYRFVDRPECIGRVWPLRGKAIGEQAWCEDGRRQHDLGTVKIIGTHLIKNWLEEALGQGHFSDTLTMKWFDQFISSETPKTVRGSDGKPFTRWELVPGRRDEARDAFVYAHAGARLFIEDLDVNQMCDNLKL